jgi:hypothetical protein
MTLVEVNWRPDRRQLRNFGLTGGTASGIGAAWLLVGRGLLGHAPPGAVGLTVGWVLAGLAAALLLLALAWPAGLRPAYLVVTAVGLPVGIALSYAVLAVVYYGLFTPIALIFRLIGRDVLRRKFDPDVKTYWVRRRTGKDVRRYFRQF